MMMSPNPSMRVGVIAARDAEVGPIVKAINKEGQQEFNLVEVIQPSFNFLEDIRAAEPTLLLIDSQVGDQSVLDVIDEVITEFPNISVIALIPGNDPMVAQQVTLAGARAFLPRPFTEVNLLSTMRRVAQLHQIQVARGAKEVPLKKKTISPVKMITVFSSEGGAGCSTVAANLAIAIKRKQDAEVLLMGGDLFFGQLEVLLNIKTNKSLADLIPHAGQLDETLIRNVVVEHSTGVDVLVEPSDIQLAQGIRPEELYSVIKELNQTYDYVVIDGGTSLSENSITYMDASDRVVFLTTPNLSALRNLAKFLKLMNTLTYDQEKVKFVLNRADIQGGVKATDIEKNLNIKFSGKIPDEHPKALMSLNRGIPMLVNHPGSPMSKAIKELAGSLTSSSV